MRKILSSILSVGALFVLAVAGGQVARAASYNVNQNGITFDFDTNLVNLDNLASQDITASITSNSFITNVPQDTAGFPLDPSNSYLTAFDIIVSTDGSGNLTALQVTGNYFVSYPAFSGENPFDFYCDYNVPNGNLTVDNDAGFCPGSANTNVNFGEINVSSTPEPTSAALMGGGIALVAGLSRLRRRRRA